MRWPIIFLIGTAWNSTDDPPSVCLPVVHREGNHEHLRHPNQSDALSERTCLVTRNAEPAEIPIFTLVESADRSDASEMPDQDPLIQALIDKLPKPNSIWSIDDRAKWLKAAAMAFNLIYRTPSARTRLRPP